MRWETEQCEWGWGEKGGKGQSENMMTRMRKTGTYCFWPSGLRYPPLKVNSTKVRTFVF